MRSLFFLKCIILGTYLHGEWQRWLYTALTGIPSYYPELAAACSSPTYSRSIHTRVKATFRLMIAATVRNDIICKSIAATWLAEEMAAIFVFALFSRWIAPYLPEIPSIPPEIPSIPKLLLNSNFLIAGSIISLASSAVILMKWAA